VRLKEGEETLVNIPGGAPFSSVSALYHLRRKGSEQYQIEVPVSFIPKSGHAGAMARANECLKKISPMLKGMGGKSLDLKLVDRAPGEVYANPIYHFDSMVCTKVQAMVEKTEQGRNARSLGSFSKEVQKELAPLLSEELDLSFYLNSDCDRQNSRSWHDSINCSTLTHETLHLLGLVDEYHEEAMGYTVDPKTQKVTKIKLLKERDWKQSIRSEFDCRIVGLGTSIMSHQEHAFNFAHLDPETGERLSASAIARLEKKAIRPRNSLLYPGHFEALIHPGCKAENGDYYECAQMAYSSSFEFDPKSQTLKDTPGSCGTPEVKKRCRNYAWLFSESGSAR
jgi:hypothetical protein